MCKDNYFQYEEKLDDKEFEMNNFDTDFGVCILNPVCGSSNKNFNFCFP